MPKLPQETAHIDSPAGPGRLLTILRRPALKSLTFLDLIVCLALFVCVFAIYWGVRQNQFVNFDDDLYVYDNPHVKAGLTAETIKWALTAAVSSNWMPVTLLSHAADVSLFGVNAAAHHLDNVFLHALAAALLFLLLRRTTSATAASAFVAFLFAVHPLHVESVAWIAERKDVLSAVFWFLGLYAYVRYTEKRTLARYLLVALLFCLGLMSKPMLVTFPFTLLLFDIWPLHRRDWKRMLWEKLPLLALTVCACVVTFLVQRATGAMIAQFPPGLRVETALLSYTGYIKQMFWPAGLAVFYPYPDSIPLWLPASALLTLVAITVLAIQTWRTRPYLAVGWFWYLGTLIPVIGFVQVGSQAHADRYTYIPLVGLSIIVAWGAKEVTERWPKSLPVIAASAVAVCLAWMTLTRIQTAAWQNTETLFQHAIDATGENWLAEGSLGSYLLREGKRMEARDHLETALRLNPGDPGSSNSLGVALAQTGDCEAAIPYFRTALRSNPRMAESDNNLGWCLTHVGRYDEAVTRLKAAVRLKPDYPEAYFDLGRVYSLMPGHEADAIAQFQTAVRLRPDNIDARRGLGILLSHAGRTQEAIAEFEAVLRAGPDPTVSQIIQRLRAGQ